VSFRQPLPVAVLCADDQPMFRAALRELIAATPGFVLVGEATSGQQTLDAAAAVAPDLVLMDVRIPGVDGIATSRMLVGRQRDLIVVLMSARELPPPAGHATTGARAIFVRKQDLCRELLLDLWHGRRTRCGPNWIVVPLG
jgi:two-component system, NarL family, invasion response regulator UvrY